MYAPSWRQLRGIATEGYRYDSHTSFHRSGSMVGSRLHRYPQRGAYPSIDPGPQSAATAMIRGRIRVTGDSGRVVEIRDVDSDVFRLSGNVECLASLDGGDVVVWGRSMPAPDSWFRSSRSWGCTWPALDGYSRRRRMGLRSMTDAHGMLYRVWIPLREVRRRVSAIGWDALPR
jgi:hypothetical protein